MPNRKVPVLILGGIENTLSLVRSFGKRGISVSVAAEFSCPAFNSRYIDGKYPIPSEVALGDFFYDLLLGNKCLEKLQGCVIFACSDYAIEFIATHREALQEHYLLDIQKSNLQMALLDKQETLRLAREAGIGSPGFWNVDNMEELKGHVDDIQYPVIIKPIHSHLFQKCFGVKLFVINNTEELLQQAKLVFDNELEFMVSELIPGPDTLLSSYYTHIDDNGHELYKFTKRIIRRSPPNFGGACYHATKWIPETAKTGEDFFRFIGFTGIANVEFKTDPRDGQLKIIECNARFTAAQELVSRSGIDMAYLIYCFLLGDEVDTVVEYKQGVRFLYPREDFRAFRAMRKTGDLTSFGWFKSLNHWPIVFPIFRIDDPYPWVVAMVNWVGDYLPWKE